MFQIERIENEGLYNCYANKREEILSELCSVAERTLWHGTTVKEAFTDQYPMPIASINKNGFNRSYSGLSTGMNYIRTQNASRARLQMHMRTYSFAAHT